MLKKLIKYDLKSIMKYWILGAAISFVLSLAGSFCVSLIYTERKMPSPLHVICILAAIIAIFGLIIFATFSIVIAYIRFYRNLFTDEGYLTFTLPVTRTQLLNSKIITTIVVEFLTGLVTIINVGIVLIIGFFDQEIIDIFKETIAELWKITIENFSVYMIIYAVEFVIFAFISLVLSTLLIFLCITIGSIITKKGKILVTVITYYVIYSAISTIYRLVFFFGATNFPKWISEISDNSLKLLIAIAGLTAITFIACLCAIVYSLEYRMIDKKLNLS